jgi:uncharacterized Fe-S center protein
MKQTAVEQIFDELHSKGLWSNKMEKIFEQAKEMEKQQQDEIAIGFAMSISTHCYCELGNDTRSYQQLLETYNK